MDAIFKVFLMISILAQAYTAPRSPRLTLAENTPNYIYNNFDGNPENVLSFGYDVADPATGNNQYRHEERHPNGTVIGRYGYVDPYGRPVKYTYIADKFGYRVFSDEATQRPIPIPQADEPTEPSITWTRPPKPNGNNVLHDIVTQLGTLISNTNFIKKV
ncbi:hypothetical protein PYW08_014585 [Mythimna loreyi]|uniref:Uncharacterized protein n=1 Tax=Mythimna loreyi TaxID=667449 RepID=A0ACC2R4I5_9NEOP|nr:hypothetical protein PYW08_014585 [Mythimna loreyi]